MNKIERMLQELCPNGVEYKKLGEVCEILDSKRKPVAKGKRTQGIYPYYGANGIQDYVDDYIFDGTFILLGEDGSVINTDKSPVLNWATGKIWVNNHAHILSEISSMANLRYLYFALQTKDVSGIVRGTPPKLNQENLRNIEIPVPPLPIQEEIVRILDHFTELTASLQAELQARKEQYEYYRDKLLTFNILPPPIRNSVTWMKMSEICSVYTGGEMPKNSIISDVKTELYKYPIYANGKDVYGYSDSFRIKDDSVCISSIGANAGTVFFKKGYFTPIIRLKVIVPLTNTINTKYLYYAVSTLRINTKGNGGIPNINANDIKKLLVPIPSLSEQQRIVSILDKFETLVNDLSQGLPAEIAAVQEQYEYYRNKLLTFKRIA